MDALKNEIENSKPHLTYKKLSKELSNILSKVVL